MHISWIWISLATFDRWPQSCQEKLKFREGKTLVSDFFWLPFIYYWKVLKVKFGRKVLSITGTTNKSIAASISIDPESFQISMQGINHSINQIFIATVMHPLLRQNCSIHFGFVSCSRWLHMVILIDCDLKDFKPCCFLFLKMSGRQFRLLSQWMSRYFAACWRKYLRACFRLKCFTLTYIWKFGSTGFDSQS